MSDPTFKALDAEGTPIVEGAQYLSVNGRVFKVIRQTWSTSEHVTCREVRRGKRGWYEARGGDTGTYASGLIPVSDLELKYIFTRLDAQRLFSERAHNGPAGERNRRQIAEHRQKVDAARKSVARGETVWDINKRTPWRNK